MKKNILVAAFLGLTLMTMLSSCDETVDCQNVTYDQLFTIEADRVYCFPDGAEMEVLSLNNNFCPCNMLCIWEGQMTLEINWTDANGLKRTGAVSTHPTAEVTVENELEDLDVVTATEWEIDFEEECSNSNPSPNILSAEIMVRE